MRRKKAIVEILNCSLFETEFAYFETQGMKKETNNAKHKIKKKLYKCKILGHERTTNDHSTPRIQFFPPLTKAELTAGGEVISNNPLDLLCISVEVDALQPIDQALVSEMAVSPKLKHMVSLVDTQIGAEGFDFICHQEAQIASQHCPLIPRIEGMGKLSEQLNWKLKGREMGINFPADNMALICFICSKWPEEARTGQPFSHQHAIQCVWCTCT